MVVGYVGRFKVTQPLLLVSSPPSKHYVIFKTSSSFFSRIIPCFVFPLSLAKGLAPFTYTVKLCHVTCVLWPSKLSGSEQTWHTTSLPINVDEKSLWLPFFEPVPSLFWLPPEVRFITASTADGMGFELFYGNAN